MKKTIITLMTIIALVFIDQWTKSLAVTHLMNTSGVSLIPNVFKLLYLENRGSAFGMMQNKQTFFIIFTLIVIVILPIIYYRIPDSKKMLPLRLVCIGFYAGAIGNFIDRLTNQYVVDFLYFELIDFPIFNVADIYVTLSCITLFILIVFYYKDEDLTFLNFRKKDRNK